MNGRNQPDVDSDDPIAKVSCQPISPPQSSHFEMTATGRNLTLTKLLRLPAPAAKELLAKPFKNGEYALFKLATPTFRQSNKVVVASWTKRLPHRPPRPRPLRRGTLGKHFAVRQSAELAAFDAEAHVLAIGQNLGVERDEAARSRRCDSGVLVAQRAWTPSRRCGRQQAR